MPLTTVTGSWEPSATWRYQWYRVSAGGKTRAISGATKVSYKPTATDQDRPLKVRVTGYRSGYVTTSRYSEPTRPVQRGMAGATPKVIGTPRVDENLVADEGAWSPIETAFSYQWYARSPSGKVYTITGATARTYQVEGRFSGYMLKVAVTGTASDYAPVTKTSGYATSVAKASFSAKPTPVIAGTARVGSTLTVDVCDWQPTPSAFGYQWYRTGAAISGATKNVYALTGDDEGETITVRVTASRAGYVSASTTSQASTTVAE
jgi:hypothetical protein